MRGSLPQPVRLPALLRRREPERPSIPVPPRAGQLAADDELWAAERAARDSHSEDDAWQ